MSRGTRRPNSNTSAHQNACRANAPRGCTLSPLHAQGNEMGVILCTKHGDSEFTQRISHNVAKKFRDDIPVSDENLRVVKTKMYDGCDFLGTDVYLISQTEFDRSVLSTINKSHSEDECDSFISELPEMSGICFDGLQKYKAKHHLTLHSFD